MTYHVEPATLDLVMQVAPVMRDEDKAEVWASDHWMPEEALAQSFHSSTAAWVGMCDDEVFCAYGVAERSVLSPKGVPWLLTSRHLPLHGRAFLRGSILFMRDMKARYDWLENYVDARYAVSICWLRWLGFTLEPAAPFGAEQLPFHRCTWRA